MNSTDKLLQLRLSQSSCYPEMWSKISPSTPTSNRPSMTSLPRSQGSILLVQRRVGENPGNEVTTSRAGAKTVERLLVCRSASWLLVIVHCTNLFCKKQFSGSTQQVTAPIFRHLATSLTGWVFIACTTSITSVNLKWKHHKSSLYKNKHSCRLDYQQLFSKWATRYQKSCFHFHSWQSINFLKQFFNSFKLHCWFTSRVATLNFSRWMTYIMTADKAHIFSYPGVTTITLSLLPLAVSLAWSRRWLNKVVVRESCKTAIINKIIKISVLYYS